MRSTFLKPASCLLFIAILLIRVDIVCCQTKKNTSAPNVLFIAVDDLKPTLGCYGDSIALTPNIDALAKQGITFIKNYCQQAVCAPSRASLLTGRYPDQLQVWDLQTVFREKNPGIITLPQYFRNNGYTTAATGKIYDPRSLEDGWGGAHDAPSWSLAYEYPGDYYNAESGSPLYYYASEEALDTIVKLQSIAREEGFSTYNEIREFVKKYYFPATEAANVPYDAYLDGALANHGLSLLENLAATESPFFLAVGFNRPHLPFAAPQKYWDLYAREELPLAAYQQKASNSPEIAYHNSSELRNGYSGVPEDLIFPVSYQKELVHGYYAAVSYIDDMIGMLINKLESLNIRENTIIVLWGDHGWHLGDHGLWCKHSNFEQATRAPLIISAPNISQAGTKYMHPTEFTDIAPTLCELAGLKTPVFFEGLSLAPLFENSNQRIRATALSQFPRNNQQIMGYTIRSGHYRYTRWIEQSTGVSKGEELYDYTNDPNETMSLINHPAYDSIQHAMDSLLQNRIENPSSKPKVRFKGIGQDNSGSVFTVPGCTLHLDDTSFLTQSDGFLDLNLPPGCYSYTLKKKGYTDASGTFCLQQDTLITDTLIPFVNQVSIRIRDAVDVLPVINSTVVLNKDTLLTNSEGIVSLDSLYSGVYPLTVSKTHFVDLHVLVEIYSDTTLTLELNELEYTAEIKVFNEKDNEPISGVDVKMFAVHSMTDLSGSVRFLMPTGIYKLEASREQYTQFSDSVTIQSDTILHVWLIKTHGDLKIKLLNEQTPVNNSYVVLDEDTLISNALGMVIFRDLAFDGWYGYSIWDERYGDVSDSIYFSTDTTLTVQLVAAVSGWAEPNQQHEIKIYPVPVEHILNITTSVRLDNIRLYDLSGQLIKNYHPVQATLKLNLSDVKPGAYLLKFTWGSNQCIKKLFIK